MFAVRVWMVIVANVVAFSLGEAELAEAQAKVKCGSILGGGKTYVLTRDLTCGQFGDPDDGYQGRVGMVRVAEGATLDLNGHVMTCDPNYAGPFASQPYGIVVRDATVRGGTVRGCALGVVPSNSVVKGMTLTDNRVGIQLIEKYITRNNYIIGNTLQRNHVGIAIQESVGETLIDNVAQDNSGFGFSVEDSGATLIGNTALRNGQAGFRWSGNGYLGRPARLLGNRAEANDMGFRIESNRGEVIGNIAERNASHGFDVQIANAEYDALRQNVAHANGGDGFSLRVSAAVPAGTMAGNNATNNRGYGIRVREGILGSPPALTISENTALNNRTFDLADETNCSGAIWQANRFETAAQPCIH